MVKIDAIARRILGWKLNRWDRWYDYETGTFIHDAEFQPEQNLSHAMMIVDRLEALGYSYKIHEASRVCFNDICATGNTLAQAITNAAYALIEQNSMVHHSPNVWRKLC